MRYAKKVNLHDRAFVVAPRQKGFFEEWGAKSSATLSRKKIPFSRSFSLERKAYTSRGAPEGRNLPRVPAVSPKSSRARGVISPPSCSLVFFYSSEDLRLLIPTFPQREGYHVVRRGAPSAFFVAEDCL